MRKSTEQQQEHSAFPQQYSENDTCKQFHQAENNNAIWQKES